MPNEFQSIQSGAGLLKDNYNETTSISDALSMRVKKRKYKLPDETKSQKTLKEQMGDEDDRD